MRGLVHNLHENKNFILYEDLGRIIVSTFSHFIHTRNKYVFPVLYLTHEVWLDQSKTMQTIVKIWKGKHNMPHWFLIHTSQSTHWTAYSQCSWESLFDKLRMRKAGLCTIFYIFGWGITELLGSGGANWLVVTHLDDRRQNMEHWRRNNNNNLFIQSTHTVTLDTFKYVISTVWKTCPSDS